MKRLFLFILTFSCLIQSAMAQRGRNDLIVSAEVGFPAGDFKNFNTGIGFSGKLLLGLEEYSQLSFTSGYSSFKMKGSTDAYKVKTTVIPLLVGYRYNLRPLYLEPQLGYGIYGSKTKTEVNGTETSSSSSRGALTLALGAGLRLSNLDLGARYQIGLRKGSSVGFFGLHLGYNLFADKD